MSQLRLELARHPRITVLLFAFAVVMVLVIGCDLAGQKGIAGSEFVEARVDTITVRDTIVVVDTVLVEREVVNRVEVPAEVPALYQRAWDRLVAEMAAGFADEKTCFASLDSMEVRVGMNEAAEEILSKQRVKDKFELTLRRYGVAVSNSSTPYLSLSIEGFWNEEKTSTIYVLQVSLVEPLSFYRNSKPHRRYVYLWEELSYGYAGKNVAKETFLRSIEEKAERVANLYLSAN